MNGVLGEAEPWRQVFRELDRVVDVPCPVLLTGPHGCGKHTCARALHRASAPDQPFVFVDSATVRAVGERQDRIARSSDPDSWMALARSGTVFVKELTALPPSAQLVLEDALRRGSHGGGLRLIVGSEHPAEVLRTHPGVRRDLFYRVSILSCAVPPLRERGHDVLLLARDCLRTVHARSRGRERAQTEDALVFGPAAERLLLSHSWPGNVCELRNVVEHAAAVAEGAMIRPTDLPSYLRRLSTAPEPTALLPREGIDLRQAVDTLENRLLQEALDRTDWNKQHAARLLGINRTTLVEMLKRKRLQRLTPPG